MAKRKRAGKSDYSYFQKLFEENPSWLDIHSNVEIYKRYRLDHGLAEDAKIPDKVKNALANKKSLMNKERSVNGKPKGKPGRKPGSKVMPAAAMHRPANLRLLEEQIDDCLATALTFDRHGLESVIKQLRHARDEVVVKANGR